MKSNQTKVNKHIQIEDLNHNEIQKLKKLDDKELSNVVGGLYSDPDNGSPCPMGGTLGKIICG